MLLKWLRAAGEPSRLRLLTLCGDATLSVSELARALKQSEARVSRHLKILCEAGLLERLRQGQWVQYRLASEAEAVSFVRGLLAQLERRDPQLLRDAAAARVMAAPAVHGGESRLGRALAAFLTASGFGATVDAVLVVGVTHLELLESAARAAQRCTALAPTRRAAQGARAFAERRAFGCEVLQASSSEAPVRADFVRAARTAPLFAAVILDYPTAGRELLPRVLQETRRALAPGGRLWIFEPYEALESSRGRVVEHPLARLRRLLGEADLRCERLSPIESDGEHVLAALALASAAGQERALTAEGAAR